MCGEVHISSQVPEGWRCGRCRRGIHQFDLCRSYGLYEHPLREIVHRFKYAKRSRLGKRLAPLLFAAWQRFPELQSADLIVPLPLHRQRERERGFNQSKILAQYLSRLARRPFEARVLKRTRNTPSQTGLSIRQRRLNVAGAFHVRRPEVLWGKTCLVIDDVFTTGATLNEVAKTLKASGAGRVFVLTLARVSPRAALR